MCFHIGIGYLDWIKGVCYMTKFNEYVSVKAVKTAGVILEDIAPH